MPLGILSDSELEQEIENLSKKPKESQPLGKIVDLKIGRGKGKTEVPEVIRKVIGEEAVRNGNTSAKEIARALDISDSSVSAYKNGTTSTANYGKPNEALSEHLEQTKKEISIVSRVRILEALERITPEKLDAAKVRDVAGVAKDMSVIIKNMEGDDDSKKEDKRPLVIYAPTLRDERTFEVIQTRE